jgi:hypothetical protein
MKKLRKRLVYGAFAFLGVLGLYVLTSPLVLPRVIDNKTGHLIYAPIAYSLQKAWFGRPVVDWYCYDICRGLCWCHREAAE